MFLVRVLNVLCGRTVMVPDASAYDRGVEENWTRSSYILYVLP